MTKRNENKKPETVKPPVAPVTPAPAPVVPETTPAPVANPFANLTPEQLLEAVTKMSQVIEVQNKTMQDKDEKIKFATEQAKTLASKLNDKFPSQLPFNSSHHLELVEGMTLEMLKNEYRNSEYIIGLDEGEKTLTYCFVAFIHQATKKVQTFQINKPKQTNYYGINIPFTFDHFADNTLVNVVDSKKNQVYFYPFQIYRLVETPATVEKQDQE